VYSLNGLLISRDFEEAVEQHFAEHLPLPPRHLCTAGADGRSGARVRYTKVVYKGVGDFRSKIPDVEARKTIDTFRNLNGRIPDEDVLEHDIVCNPWLKIDPIHVAGSGVLLDHVAAACALQSDAEIRERQKAGRGSNGVSISTGHVMADTIVVAVEKADPSAWVIAVSIPGADVSFNIIVGC